MVAAGRLSGSGRNGHQLAMWWRTGACLPQGCFPHLPAALYGLP
jgi:hypothetical protein